MTQLPEAEVQRRLAAAHRFAAEGRSKAECARYLGLKSNTFVYWIANMPGAPQAWAGPSRATIAAGDAAPEPTPQDRLRLHAAKGDLATARSEIKVLRDMVLALETYREDLLGVTGSPLQPRPIVADPGGAGCMSWLICVSDYHLGKRFDRSQVFGLQDYSVDIALARLSRQFQASARMIRDHSDRVDRIVVSLHGDNANGELRRDDTASNEIPPMQQARAFAEGVVGGVDHLLERFPDVEIEIIALPGNHGRTQQLPPSVQIGENYDIVIGWLVAAHYRTETRVRVCCAEQQPDILLPIYGQGALLTHGDRIGSNGGDGQIGALGPTKRGGLKIEGQMAEVRRYISTLPQVGFVLMGHFHYYWTDCDVMVSGAGIGVDQWSLFKLRVKPRPPRMPLLGFHSRRGLILPLTVFPGHPDEGPMLAHPNGQEVARASREIGVDAG